MVSSVRPFAPALPPSFASSNPPPAADTAYRAAIASYMTQEQVDIHKLGLTQKPGNQSYARFHEGRAPKGVIVLLHGFSAGTQQWHYDREHQYGRDYVDDLFDKGYDVFVPALPGHGLVDAQGHDDTSHLPDAIHDRAWEGQFGERIYQLVRPAGRVTLAGLSVGGALVLQIAERHAGDKINGRPVIQQVKALSPFLTPAGTYALGLSNNSVANIFRFLTSIPILGALFHLLLKAMPKDMRGPGDPAFDYGFSRFNQDQALALTTLGKHTSAAAAQLHDVPVEFIVSDADATADATSNVAVAKKASARLCEFPAGLHINHDVLSPQEYKDPALFRRVRERVLSGL